MKNIPHIYIADTGMITAVGANTKMTACAVRTGTNMYHASQNHNKRLKPMKIAWVPDDALPVLSDKLASMEMLTARQTRMLLLAEPALKEAMKNYPLNTSIPLFLSGPEIIPGCPPPIQDNFIDHLIIQTGANIDRKNSRFFATGRVGGFQAVDMVFKYFEATGMDYALLGGVDSCQDLFSLGFLDSENRILSEGVKDGFAPGEAAGFLLLVSERIRTLTQQALTRVYPPGWGTETGHRYSDLPYKGEGLAVAFQHALKNGPGTPINTIYTSLNGESFGSKEYGVASTRNNSALAETIALEHPADCFGDIGAAVGPVLMALSHYGFSNKLLKGGCLSYASAETEARAAVCLSA